MTVQELYENLGRLIEAGQGDPEVVNPSGDHEIRDSTFDGLRVGSALDNSGSGSELEIVNCTGRNLQLEIDWKANPEIVLDFGHSKIEGITGLPPVPAPDGNLYQEILGRWDRVDMSAWHGECGTVHCIAGWAVTLGGCGAEIQETLLTTQTVATAIFAQTRSGRFPPFFAHIDLARVALEKMAASEAECLAAQNPDPVNP